MNQTPDKPTQPAAGQPQPPERRQLQAAWADLRRPLGPEAWSRINRRLSILRISTQASKIALGLTLIGIVVFFLRMVFNLSRFRGPLYNLYLEPFLFIIPAAAVIAYIIRFLTWRRLSTEPLLHNLSESHASALRQIIAASAAAGSSRTRQQTAPETSTTWWRVELSGVHFFLWLFLALSLLSGLFEDIFPLPAIIFFILVSVTGTLIKIAYWAIYTFSSEQNRRELDYLYRWAGTLNGTMDIAIIALILFFIMAFAFIGLSRWFGE